MVHLFKNLKRNEVDSSLLCHPPLLLILDYRFILLDLKRRNLNAKVTQCTALSAEIFGSRCRVYLWPAAMAHTGKVTVIRPVAF